MWPTREHPRKVLMLMGCVQPAMMPNINSATARVLDAAGIQTLVADDAGCCGAIRTHLNDPEGGLADMRRNIDAWWPLVEGLTSQGKVEAIVMNASGCGVTVKEYGHALAHDPAYADKAARISALTRDLGELLPDAAPRLKPRLHGVKGRKLAFHPPCTLQHGQQLRGGVEAGLRELGFDVQLAASREPSVLRLGRHLQRAAARAGLRVARPQARPARPDRAPKPSSRPTSAASSTCRPARTTPVRHWVEVLDDALAGVSR